MLNYIITAKNSILNLVRRMLKLTVFYTSLILLFLVLFSLIGFYLAIRPIKFTSVITPLDLTMPYETVEFLTQDNIKLRGWFIPNADPNAKTIILLHGYPADKGNILSAMAPLHDDYHLFLFDFRYFGESEGRYTTVGKNETKDLLAAINYLASRNIHEVGVWGFSLGGAVALLTAPDAPAIKAIVAESPYARLDWITQDYYPIPILKYPLAALTRFWAKLFLNESITKISPVEAAEKLKIPVLIIHSSQDQMIPYRHAQAYQTALKDHPNIQLLTTQGKHGELAPGYTKIINDFFQKAMR